MSKTIQHKALIAWHNLSDDESSLWTLLGGAYACLGIRRFENLQYIHIEWEKYDSIWVHFFSFNPYKPKGVGSLNLPSQRAHRLENF